MLRARSRKQVTKRAMTRIFWYGYSSAYPVVSLAIEEPNVQLESSYEKALLGFALVSAIATECNLPSMFEGAIIGMHRLVGVLFDGLDCN